jgi:hypothetical protein
MKSGPLDFMPLCAAAAIAYSTAVEDPRCSSEQELDERLNGAATALSTTIPIFTLCGAAPEPTVVRQNELARGAFRGGAHTLEFRDGATPLVNLLVRKTDLVAAIPQLRA